MDITYRTKKLEKCCTDFSVASKVYGRENATKIFLRCDQLAATESIETLLKVGGGRLHALKGKRSGQFAYDLVHPMRLCFSVENREIVVNAVIEDIVDYHHHDKR